MDDLFEDSPFRDKEEQQDTDPVPAESSQKVVSFGFPSGAEPVAVSQEPFDDDDGGGHVVAKEPTTPRDDIKVSVKGYQTETDDFVFDVEVEVNGQSKLVSRRYKDIQWLHRNLSRRMELGGYILPPIPTPPAKSADPKVVVLGDDSKAMFGDATRMPCLAVEQFMQSLAEHRFFSENDTVHTYVAKDEVSERDKLGTGTLWNSFTQVISDFQLSKIEETDEDFKIFLEYVSDLAPLLKECAMTHSKVISARLSLACSQVLIAEMLKEHSTFETFRNRAASELFQKIGDGMDNEKKCLYAQSLDGRHTMGMTFDLYHRYCLQAKEMLYRRLSKFQKLLTCTNKLDKAKPEKKQEAEDAREKAEKEFQDISETARREISLFKQKYTEFFQSNLTGYAESQLVHSRRTYDTLNDIRDQLLQVN